MNLFFKKVLAPVFLLFLFLSGTGATASDSNAANTDSALVAQYLRKQVVPKIESRPLLQSTTKTAASRINAMSEDVNISDVNQAFVLSTTRETPSPTPSTAETPGTDPALQLLVESPAFVHNTAAALRKMDWQNEQTDMFGGSEPGTPMKVSPTQTITDVPVCVSIRGQDIGSGVILTPTYILTAAHVAQDAVVVIPGHDATDLSGAIPVKRPIYDPAAPYDPVTGANDIALLELTKPLPTVSHANVCSYSPWISSNPQIFVIAGFGPVSRSDPGTVGALHFALTNIVAAGTASPQFPFHPDTEVVLGNLEKQIDTCHGDSGGPALLYSGGTPFVVAVCSRGPGGDLCGPAGIFVRVDPYASWIHDVIAP